ncbi:autotransporter domain-containing protein [Sinorhizobium sp. BG8]|uniref:autotransporter domain-containing protein n=1 Tax=Sinorhizobium sp. BG8 TaxID=2613773 RepID=UPI00193E021E|nr:autotransporter domain-containing protein [Sinorhizobium sp. BG8]QRM55397.1 autotransporter domain-containing protein [Sinorhizobium sp. BG8]
MRDSAGNQAKANYSLIIGTPTFTFTPSGGALTEAMVGEAYSQKISAEGGTGALIYSVVSGELPKGMVLNISTGELTGPLAEDAEAKDYSFTLQARDSVGFTGTASFTLTVKARAATVPAVRTSNVLPGGVANVDLDLLSTGGTITSADILYVEPDVVAGTVTIVRGDFAQLAPSASELGWYLKFTPKPAFSGEARVSYTITTALGTSNIGTIIFRVGYDPDEVAQDMDRYVHDFVSTRQSMISSAIKVPGLLQRRQMGEATEPVTTRVSPSESGLTFGFSTSLAQLEASRNQVDGISGGYSLPFNVWLDGAFLAHRDNDMEEGKWGSFAMLSLGADYLLSDKALLGLSFHFDRTTDPVDVDAELTGNGWLAGPYASFEIGKGVYWNASLLYGGSSNDIDTLSWDGTFDTKRWLTDTSIEGQWALDPDTTLTPKLRAVYFSEKVEDYTVTNNAGDALTVEGFNEEQFRVSLGAEIARSFTLESGSTLTPKIGVTGGFSGLDGSGAFSNLTAELSLNTTDDWTLDFGLLFNLEGEGETSVGARAQTSKRF